MRTITVLLAVFALLAVTCCAMAAAPPTCPGTATSMTTWTASSAVPFAGAAGASQGRTEVGAVLTARAQGGADDAVLMTVASIAGVVPPAPASCRDVGTLLTVTTDSAIVAAASPKDTLVGTATEPWTTDSHLVAADDVGSATHDRRMDAARPPEGKVVCGLAVAVGFVPAC